MSFISLTFIVFCLLVLAVYWAARGKTVQNAILLAASYIFYGWVHPWYAVLLGFSTLADYFLSRGMARNRDKARRYLWVSLFVNVGVLAFFKYYNFFNETLAASLSMDFFFINVALPFGLSFFTIKKVMYMVDAALGRLEPDPNLVDFALYVSFFPQIVAGPIDRAQKLLPQFKSARRWQAEFFHEAWPLMVMGFFKKVVIADTAKSMVDRIFTIETPTHLLIGIAALGFTLQILADFSAYTDFSRGVARLFGLETAENFNNPYLALTPSEFWNRWHITLSNFLRDYVFFPLRRLSMRRKGWPSWFVQAMPPMITMFVSGLWHGAGWTFVLWGIFHGLLILAYQAAGIRGEWKPASKLKLAGAWLVMFSLIVFSWLIFRAPSLAWLVGLTRLPLVGSTNEITVALIALATFAFYALALLVKLGLDRLTRSDSWWQAAYYTAAMMMIILYTNSSNPDFIYFQF
jgi:D-alanyl-lipoteichoic acid acyltransferase DltB (MBOAT superfamily)